MTAIRAVWYWTLALLAAACMCASRSHSAEIVGSGTLGANPFQSTGSAPLLRSSYMEARAGLAVSWPYAELGAVANLNTVTTSLLPVLRVQGGSDTIRGGFSFLAGPAYLLDGSVWGSRFELGVFVTAKLIDTIRFRAEVAGARERFDVSQFGSSEQTVELLTFPIRVGLDVIF